LTGSDVDIFLIFFAIRLELKLNFFEV